MNNLSSVPKIEKQPIFDQRGRKFDKAKSTGRIDALVALAMALSLALLRTEKQIDIRALIG